MFTAIIATLAATLAIYALMFALAKFAPIRK
jgi:hypothetical protein